MLFKGFLLNLRGDGRKLDTENHSLEYEGWWMSGDSVVRFQAFQVMMFQDLDYRCFLKIWKDLNLQKWHELHLYHDLSMLFEQKITRMTNATIIVSTWEGHIINHPCFWLGPVFCYYPLTLDSVNIKHDGERSTGNVPFWRHTSTIPTDVLDWRKLFQGFPVLICRHVTLGPLHSWISIMETNLATTSIQWLRGSG